MLTYIDYAEHPGLAKRKSDALENKFPENRFVMRFSSPGYALDIYVIDDNSILNIYDMVKLSRSTQ